MKRRVLVYAALDRAAYEQGRTGYAGVADSVKLGVERAQMLCTIEYAKRAEMGVTFGFAAVCVEVDGVADCIFELDVPSRLVP